MTQEEKAKAYDKVREKIAIRFGSNVADEIFSKFEMSEDEKIRKELIDFFSDKDESDYEGLHPRTEIVAWLEKQVSLKDIVDRHKNSWYNEGKIAGMAEGLTDDEKYQQGWHDALEKQGEQKPQRMVSAEAKEALYDKPAWSEEDTSLCIRIQGILSVCKSNSLLSPDLCKEMCDWLKSLKERIGG